MSSNSDANDLGRRYLPFLVFLAVMALLIVLAPSKGAQTSVSSGAFGSGGQYGSSPSGGGQAAGNQAGAAGAAAGSSTGATGSGAGTPGGYQGGSGGGSAGVRGAGGPGGGGTASTATAGSAKPDLSDCMPDGSQRPGRAAFFYMLPCTPVWHGGNNGGATMTGVSATTISFTVYVQQVPAEVAQIAAAAGVTDSPDQICATGKAFQAALQKYFVMYGRHLVPLDGPGSNAGSKQTDNGCYYPYYQSQCQSSPPDQACIRTDGDTIAAMKPAIVLYNGDSTLAAELAAKHIVAVGYPAIPNPSKSYQQWAPYIWSAGADGTFQAGIAAQYFCNRLANRPPSYGGAGVQTLPYPANRNVGFIYPEDNGNTTAQEEADLFLGDAHGCGDPAAKGYSYTSDLTTIAEQASTLVASLQADHVTTVACYCDPFGLLFILEAAQNDQYFPEWLSMATSGTDQDAAGQLYQKSASNEWIHAFGIGVVPLNSNLNNEYQQAYKDGGGTGNESAFDQNSWDFGAFPMGEMIQSAGPDLTPANMLAGMEAIPAMGGSFETEFPLGKVDAWGQWRGNDPDPIGDAIRDVREIWWNPNAVSKQNGSAGAYCSTNGGQRVQYGQWPHSAPNVFNSQDCAL